MPFIQNVAASDIKTGHYKFPGDNSMLIQISDPGSSKPEAPHFFSEVHQFEFLDIEKDDTTFDESCKCNQEQANQLVKLLQHALEQNMNVIVHCFAGICRSGAVCEVGVMLGFEDTGVYRQPNLLVKHQMMKTLGWTYDENEESAPINLSAKFGWEGDI